MSTENKKWLSKYITYLYNKQHKINKEKQDDYKN